MKMKPIAAAMLVAGVLCTTGPAFASGIPVVDAAQLIEWAQQIMELQKQYQQMQKDFEIYQQQLASMTGSYGHGGFNLPGSINASNVVPGSWQDIVSMQVNGKYGALSNEINEDLGTIDLESIGSDQGKKTYRRSSSAVRSSMAGAQVLYEEIQEHMKTLQSLAGKIDTTQNIKEAQDLASRINIEQAFLNSAYAKASMLNLNLQASMQDGINQARQKTNHFFSE